MADVIRRRVVRAALGGLGTLAAACSPLAILNRAVPSATFDATRDIAYGTDARQKLDVYVPRPARAKAPVVVFFYGGNWHVGERADYLFVGEALASRGIASVIPDYRLYPNVRFPVFLDDCARAVRWTLDNAERFGADPARLFLMGHSAGAYNAAMLALNAQYLRAAGVDARRVHGLIGLAGPYDFLPLQSDVTKGVFGYPDTPRSTQPIEFVSRPTPPTLLITAAEDEFVDPSNSTRLAARLRNAGGVVREIALRRVGHRTLIGALAAPLRWMAPVLDEVAQFVNATPTG